MWRAVYTCENLVYRVRGHIPGGSSAHPYSNIVRSFPEIAQESHFFVPSNQRGQAVRRDDVEPGLRPALVQDSIDLEGLGQTFERRRPERLTHKIALDQVRGGLADHHRIW